MVRKREEEMGEKEEEDEEGIDRGHTDLEEHLQLQFHIAWITYLAEQRRNAVELYPQLPNTLPFTFQSV